MLGSISFIHLDSRQHSTYYYWWSEDLAAYLFARPACNAYFFSMHTQLIVSCETQFVSQFYTPKIHQFDILYAI